MKNFNQYAKGIVLGKEILQEVIYKLNKEIENNPNSDSYCFMIDYSRCRDAIIENNEVEHIIKHYEDKGFNVCFTNDEINCCQKIKLTIKQYGELRGI